MAEAAARLAKYTSEHEAGPLPEQQWADLYKEGSVWDASGGGESTAPCDLVVACAPPPGAAGHGGQGLSAQEAGEGGPGRAAQEQWHVACGPHKVGPA